MRILLILVMALSAVGCNSMSLDYHMDQAYKQYNAGDCDKAMLELSQAERKSRSRSYVQPEISLLRGQCLERENLFVDAAQTYQFIIARYPSSEYAYRARARLDTLQQIGHKPNQPAKVSAAPL
ncbi:outer membrane protein assembly factor BamD (BamD/ComL family) [Pseudomonas sp. TE3786]